MSLSDSTDTATQPDGDRERVAIAADHAGVDLKRSLVEHLRERGFDVEDLGPHSNDSVDYPDFAHQLAARVANGDCTSGFCSS